MVVTEIDCLVASEQGTPRQPLPDCLPTETRSAPYQRATFKVQLPLQCGRVQPERANALPRGGRELIAGGAIPWWTGLA